MGVHGFTADQLFVEMSLCSHLLRYGPCVTELDKDRENISSDSDHQYQKEKSHGETSGSDEQLQQDTLK
ncbi:hypothetical protein YC2023_114007 [Brassica napus]